MSGFLLVAVVAACSDAENSNPNSPGGQTAGAASGGSAGSGGAAAGVGGSAAGIPNAGAATMGGSNMSMGGSGGAITNGGSASGGGGGSPSAGSSNAGSSNGGSPNGGSPNGGSGGGSNDPRSPANTCARWKADTANLSEGTWSGSVDTCTAGDISADGRENALRMVNLVRWLADLPAVTTDDTSNQLAQACALMMTANDDLDHNPPMDWDCYTKTGADGAGSSNISSAPGVVSVLSYMVDDGNEKTHGHRRWILSNGLGPIGLGSAGQGGASCMRVFGGKGNANKPWMAWPPPGAFPMQAYHDKYGRKLDETGWSIQSDLELEGAQVTITSGGQAKPVNVTQLDHNYGAANAIRIVPSGWSAEPGSTYSVNVSGAGAPISYEVQMIDCN